MIIPDRITFRLKAEEKSTFAKRLKESGIKTISEFCRQAALHRAIKPPAPQELHTLNSEINHIGNNLNQLTKIAHTTGRIAEDTADALREVQILLKVVQKLIRPLL